MCQTHFIASLQARLLATGEIVAVKIVKYGSQEELDDFQTEIDILATCHHKNVLKLYDAYWWKDHFYVCNCVLYTIRWCETSLQIP